MNRQLYKQVKAVQIYIIPLIKLQRRRYTESLEKPDQTAECLRWVIFPKRWLKNSDQIFLAHFFFNWGNTGLWHHHRPRVHDSRIHYSVLPTQCLLPTCHHAMAPFTHFTLPLPSGSHRPAVCICEFDFVLSVVYLLHTREITGRLSLSTSLSTNTLVVRPPVANPLPTLGLTDLPAPTAHAHSYACRKTQGNMNPSWKRHAK